MIEDYDNLGVEPRGPNYVLTTVNAGSNLIALSWTAPPPARTPARPNPVEFADAQLDGGDDGDAAPTLANYVGAAATATSPATGLTALAAIDEIALLCVPDEVDRPLTSSPSRSCSSASGSRTGSPCSRSREGQSDVNQINRRPAEPLRRDLLPVDPGLRSRAPRDTVLVPPGRARRRHLRPHRHRPRRAQGAGQRGRARHHHPRPAAATERPLEFKVTKGAAGHPQPARHQRHPRLPRRPARHPGVGRAHDAPPTRSGSTSTSAGCSSSSRSRSTRARSGSSSSRTTSRRGRACGAASSNFLTRVWRDGALDGRDRGGGVLRQVRPHDDDPGRHRQRPAHLLHRHRAGQAGGVRDLPHQPEDARGQRQRRRGGASTMPTPATQRPVLGSSTSSSRSTGSTSRGFSEVSGLTPRQDSIEYRDGNEDITVRKLPGLRKYPNIIAQARLHHGHGACGTGARRSSTAGPSASPARSCCSTRPARRRCAGTSARAGRRKLEGPPLNAKTNEVAIETLEIAHEGLELE